MRLGYTLIKHLGPKIGLNGTKRLGTALGQLMWHLVGSRRRLATEAIEKHLCMSEEQARTIAQASFSHNFRSFLELLQLDKIDENFCKYTIRESTPGAFARALEFDGPIVGVTAHLGGWEVLAGVLGNVVGRQRDDTIVVVRRNKNPNIHALITYFRELQGIRVVDHRQAVFTVMKTLKKKGFAAFLVDHNCPRNEAIFLPFLKDIAAVNMGPAVLAVRGNAAVLPVFLVRDGQGGYILHVDEMLTPDSLTGTRNDKIRQVAEFYTRNVEKYVTLYPEQWFWMHKRWKTRPETSLEVSDEVLQRGQD